MSIDKMDQAIKYSSQPFLWRNVTDSLIFTTMMVLSMWFVKVIWDRRKIYYHNMYVTGPLALPIIGALYKFAFATTTSDILRVINEVQKAHPDLCTFWFGPKLIYLVAKPEHIEKILTSPHCLNKDNLYRFVSKAIGPGLMTLEASVWKKHRKLISPSFNQRILDSFVEIFENHAILLKDQLKKHVGKPNFDIFHLINNCTLDIICETAMGVKMNAQTEECEFAKVTDKMMELVTRRIFHIIYHPNALFNMFSLSTEYHENKKKFQSFCRDVIRKKYKAYQKRLADQASGLTVEIEERGSKKIKAFLDLILEYGVFNEDELNNEVNIFIIAGTDTTATALTAIFLSLALHPDIQEKVYEEIISTVGEDGNIQPSVFSKLKYMDRAIKESLRLFPVAPFFLRRIEEDLDLGDVVMPKGTSAFFGTIHLHRSPKYWEDPLKFDPDRFLPENVAKRQPCSYIPFSYGPRNCIGGRYAMMNMKTLLCTVLRRFRFTTSYKSVEEIDLSSNIVLRFTHGTQLTIHER